jgi:Na+-driven multidrug efflux pump
MWNCLGAVAVIGLILGMAVFWLGRPLLSVYVKSDSAEFESIIAAGLVRMSIILPTYWLCGIMDTMVGQLRGVGCSLPPMIMSLTGVCVFRILWIATVFQANKTPEVLYWSYPVTWAITFTAHLVTWYVVSPKLFRRREAQLQE